MILECEKYDDMRWNNVCNVCDVCNKMYEIWHEMMWNTTWNDVRCDVKCNANRWFRLHATRCNLGSLIFDYDHNLIILFLILLRIWASVLMWNWLNKMSKIYVYTHVSRTDTFSLIQFFTYFESIGRLSSAQDHIITSWVSHFTSHTPSCTNSTCKKARRHPHP